MTDQLPGNHQPSPAPPGLTSAHAPNRGRRLPVIAALVGALVGAGIVGAVWLVSSASDSAASGSDPLPPPIPIGLDTLPDSVLGLQRDDLALAEKYPDQGRAQAAVATDGIAAFTQAYGGPGIQMAYGTVENTRLLLTVVNGMQPAPLTSSDAMLLRVRQIGATSALPVPGSDTVRCTAAPTRAINVDSAADLAAAKQQVLDSTDAMITCVRSDRARNVSIQLAATGAGEPPQPTTERARAFATEIDRLWGSMVR
ncbi:hypothetical protein [Nakamurella aerolata]|uniref:Uncharacterized protein n=1 Tax=Nakamurella aerolata TaxID=1656892 RepID=A0A849A815_9ACTN|nr:hypothetical protein [Nakamurella aerolata]NNG35248.1 hypothetical protein [Nakamurella aerolata]